jgi:hypothetical protein
LKASPNSSENISVANGHGGARLGAGRRPKALRYAKKVAGQEARIVAALPELIDLLLGAARSGDTSAARYLVDRVLGRVQTQAKPIAEDYSLPYDHPAAEELAAMRRRRELAKEMAPYPRGNDATDAVLVCEHLIAGAETSTLSGEDRFQAERDHLHRRRVEEQWPRPAVEKDPLEMAKVTQGGATDQVSFEAAAR